MGLNVSHKKTCTHIVSIHSHDTRDGDNILAITECGHKYIQNAQWYHGFEHLCKYCNKEINKQLTYQTYQDLQIEVKG